MYGLFELDKENFIEFKTVAAYAEIEENSETVIPCLEESLGKSYLELEQISTDIYFSELAEQYLSMSPEEKEAEFYTILIKYNRSSAGYIFEDDEAKRNFEKDVNEMLTGVETESNDYLKELADELNLSIEETISTYYKPYIPLMFIDMYLDTTDFDFQGEVVEENEKYLQMNITEDNYTEIVNYLEDTRSYLINRRLQYISYMKEQLEGFDIIE